MTQVSAPLRLNAVCADSGRALITIDLFAHRVTLKRDYTLVDVLLWLTSVALCPSRNMDSEPSVYVEFLKEYAYQGIDAPLATLERGAFCVAFDQGATGDIRLEVRGGGIYLGARHISSIQDFQYLSTFTMKNERSRADILARPEDYFGKDPKNQIGLALIAAILPYASDSYESGQVLGSIYGRASRLLDIGYPSGASGAKTASEDMRRLWQMLQNDWLIEPKHPYGTWELQLSPDLSDILKSYVSEEVQNMAREALLAARGLKPSILKEAALAVKNQKIGGNFHETLISSQTITAIDAAIEDNAPLALLRPMAQKRQSKARAQDAS